MEGRIMESPDGGKTVYERRLGEDRRVKIHGEQISREVRCRREILQVLQKYRCRIITPDPTIVAD